MNIKEVETMTGLSRSNIRFYEKEELIHPQRNEKNGYREYSDKDVNDIKKIAYLRTLDISVEDIRRIIQKEVALYSVLKRQSQSLKSQITDLENAKQLCEQMLAEKSIDFEKMEVERYVVDVNEHLEKNRKALRFDTVGFFFLWGGVMVWGIVALACFVTAVFSYPFLPDRIPIQWNHGQVSSWADRWIMFMFPLACVIIRFLLRPFIWRWLWLKSIVSDSLTDYIANYLCFIVWSVQVFLLLFLAGIVKHVVVVILVDTAVLVGVLVIGWLRGKSDEA